MLLEHTIGSSLVNGLMARATEFYHSLPAIPDIPPLTPGHVGIAVLVVGLGMAGAYAERQWLPGYKQWREARRLAKADLARKRRRVKEAMDIREVRLQDMMVEMITDGLLDRFASGKISGQEYRAKMAEFGFKMGWGDLLNAKARSEKTKEDIRERIANDVHNKETTTSDKYGVRPVSVKIPGPPPGVATEVAKSANKYWRAKTVAP